jgi:hypothetical protein
LVTGCGWFRGSRNRPAGLRNEVNTDGARAGRELRERMHATLAAGMLPAEVADKLADAIRRDALYLLTDHEWDAQIRQREESILAGATHLIDGAVNA